MNLSHTTRFQPGRSGNPNGRPRAAKAKGGSAFDILLDRTLTITQSGITRALSVEEALQHKLYEQALSGKRLAIRSVLKMIAKREKALASRTPPPPAPIKQLFERQDLTNAYEALLILGITIPDPAWGEPKRETRLLVQPWAVQAALSRRGRTSFSPADVAAIARHTWQHQTLKWPRSLMP